MKTEEGGREGGREDRERGGGRKGGQLGGGGFLLGSQVLRPDWMPIHRVAFQRPSIGGIRQVTGVRR